MDIHTRFMKKALALGAKALANGEFPVGCVMVVDGTVISEGHRKNSGGMSNEIDHAEVLALRNVLTTAGCTDLSRVTVYSTMEPCLMCFSTLIVNGVSRFVYGYEDAMGGGTNLPLKQLAPLYRDLSLDITGGVLRDQCLEQFKSFFIKTGSEYLGDSYLAEYTLKQ